MEKLIRGLLIVAGLLIVNSGQSQDLESIANSKLSSLDSLINIAEGKNIDVEREKLTSQTSKLFLKYANWDESNITTNINLFSLYWGFDDNDQTLAENLPNKERQDVIDMVDESILNIEQCLDSTIVRKNTMLQNWEDAVIDGASMLQDGVPVLLSDYVWKPGDTELRKYFGAIDGFYLNPAKVINESGTIASGIINDLANKESNRIGNVFFNHTILPSWAIAKYDNLTVGQRHYTKYDIDNPGTRELVSMLYAGTIPQMAGKRYTQLGYLLTNEPHWFTADDSWDTGTVSSYTKAKFKVWLSQKHESIEDLNTLWGTSFASFDEVTITIPISHTLRGTPKWFDWISFNNDRVTEWFLFQKNGIKKYDADMKATIKLIPTYFSENLRDHGLDFERLVRLQGISGCDAKVTNSHVSGSIQPWMARYSLEWRNLSLPYDFFKSVRPNQPIYDSETHFISTVRFRDLSLDPDYTRASYWLAHMHGLNVTETWFWGRASNGSVSSNGSTASYPGSVMQQPKVLNAIGNTYLDLNAWSVEIDKIQKQKKQIRIYYSLSSAINSDTYMDDIYDTYQSLYFEGVPLGFATDSIILEEPHSDWELIVVAGSDRVMLKEIDALQSYLDNGGTVILDDTSLKFDEYGISHGVSLNQSAGKLIYANTESEIKDNVFQELESSDKLPAIEVIETNETGPKACMWRCVEDTSGTYILTAVNIGNSAAELDISLKNALKGTSCKDLFSGKIVKTKITLEPYDVCLLRIEDEKNYFPQISFNSPLGSDINYAPADIVTDLSVGIESGSIEKVKLFLDNELIGEKSAEPYSWDSGKLSGLIAGNYTLKAVATSSAGVESIESILLKVICENSLEENITEISCGSYTINNITYTSSGDYQQILESEFGCDSIININLTVEDLDNSILQTNEQLVAVESQAEYQWIDCNDGNKEIPGATNRYYIATKNGNYAVNITKGSCEVVSDCMSVINLSAKNNFYSSFSIYPNPSSDFFHINMHEAIESVEIEISDIYGRIIHKEYHHHFEKGQIDLSLQSKGIYIINVKSKKKIYTNRIFLD